MCVPVRSVTCSYAIEKHARVPNEPFDAEEDAANFEVELVDCSSFSVCFIRNLNNTDRTASSENPPNQNTHLPPMAFPSLNSAALSLSLSPSQAFQQTPQQPSTLRHLHSEHL